MKVAVAADHAGALLIDRVLAEVKAAGHEPLDLGSHDPNTADDYSDYAVAVAHRMQRGEAERGILVCGSGVGVSVAANKFRGIRAGLCHDSYSAHQGVEHDDMNVLCLGTRVVGPELALELVRTFLAARFQANEERFRRRLAKVQALEENSEGVK